MAEAYSWGPQLLQCWCFFIITGRQNSGLSVFYRLEESVVGYPAVEKWPDLLVTAAQVGIVDYLSSLLLHTLLLSPVNFTCPNPQGYGGLHPWRPGAQCLIKRDALGQGKNILFLHPALHQEHLLKLSTCLNNVSLLASVLGP